ncbi:MAG: Tar ligand binding domain-containing protein, partial [Pseudomonadota bacterium]
MLKNLTIKSRLTFVIAFMSVLLLLIGGMGLFGINKSNEGLRSVYEDRTVALGQVATIEALLLNNRLRIAVSLVTPTPEVIKENTAAVDKNIEEVGKTWDAYMATTLTPEEKKLADQFAEDRKKFVGTGLKPTVAALREGNIKEANRLVVEVIRPTYKPVGEGIHALKQLQLDVAKQEYAQAQTSYATIRNITISAIIIGIALSIWIGFILIRAIVRPINEAVAVANAVAAGDLTSKIQVTAKDETGLLMQALKDMNENLVRLVGDVRVSADTITTASKEIAAGNADLSQRTEEQASSLEETASSMEELTSTVKQNAENAKQANQLAKGASEVAVRG